MEQTKKSKKLQYSVAAASAATVATTIFFMMKHKNK